MGELLRANILAHFAFYRRSRLLLAFALVFLLLTGLISVPALFTISHVQSFETLHAIFSTLNGFLIFFSAGLGLFIVSSHLRSRNLKMVFTKPCPPPVWVASAFLSAVMVSLLLDVLILVSMIALSLGWHVPVQAGLIFVSLETFAASIGMIAYLMFLGMTLHPAIAATLALIFSASNFQGLEMWTLAAIRAGHKSLGLRMLEHIFQFFYLALPMVHAFEQKTEPIGSSLRVSRGDWVYLLYSLGYALALSALCYCLSVFFLQRKRLI